MMIKTELHNEILIIHLNNEKKLNAISNHMIDELDQCVRQVNESDNIKVCIITGSEKAFSVGVDINEIQNITHEQSLTFLNEKWCSLLNMKVPIIACVSGYALGGGFELALMCDMIFASETSKFGFPEINLGLLPGNGGTQFLPRIIGSNKAFEIIATGQMFNSQEAYSLGIVNKVINHDHLYEETLLFAEQLSIKPLHSLIFIKSAIRASKSIPLDDGLKYERNLFQLLLNSTDTKNLTRAFLNKA